MVDRPGAPLCSTNAEGTLDPSSSDDPCSSPVIPGLPDDLALECLLRIPRADHRTARSVCRNWRSFIQSDRFYDMRSSKGLVEGWLFVLSRDSKDRLWWRALDPCTGKWHDIPKMPGESARAYGVTCVTSARRLFVIGGAGWFRPSKEDVWCYSPPGTKWKRVADLNEARCYSVGKVLNGRIHVVGGMGNDNARLLRSTEVYSIEDDSWSCASNLPMECDLEDAAVLNGQLLVRHILCIHQQANGPLAFRYNPANDVWCAENTEMTKLWHGPSVVLDGEVYKLDQIGGIRLGHFDTRKNRWVSLGRISPSLLTPPCKLLGHDGRLYIIGRGSSMVVVDLALNKRCKLADSGVLLTRRVEGAGQHSDVVVDCVVLEV